VDGVGFCGAGANGVEFGKQSGGFRGLFFGNEFADGFFDLADGGFFGDVARFAAQRSAGMFGVGSDVWHSEKVWSVRDFFQVFFLGHVEKKNSNHRSWAFFLRNFSKQAGCLIFEERSAGCEGAKVVVVYFRRSCDDDDRYDTR